MDKFIDPEKVLDELDLEPDMVVAEFGCGSGGFAIPLAKLLEQGLVYALDIQEPPLSALKSRAIIENLNNIRIIRSDLEKPRGSTLTDSCLDLVVIPNVLFQAEDKDAIIKEAIRVMKKGAKLLIIDWSPKATQGPVENRVSPEQIKEIAQKLNFKLEKEFKAGKYHYGLIFEKL